MKITIELEYGFDGPRPDDFSIRTAIADSIKNLILSEEVDGSDDWAMVLKTYEIKIDA